MNKKHSRQLSICPEADLLENLPQDQKYSEKHKKAWLKLLSESTSEMIVLESRPQRD